MKKDGQLNDTNTVTINIASISKTVPWSDALDLANQLVAQRSPHSISLFKQLIEINQKEESLYALAMQACLIVKNYVELLAFTKKACESFPDVAMHHYGLAIASRHLHYQTESFNALQQAISLAPNNLAWQRLLAIMYKEQGKLETALCHFNDVIKHAPNDYQSYWYRADISASLSDQEKSQLIDACQLELTTRQTSHSVSDKKTSNTNKANVSYAAFTLFKHFDNKHLHKEAFNYLSLANHLKRQTIPFDLKAELAEHLAIAKTFNHCFSHASPDNQLGENCIFICGLPRSGTTLVEQIISSHSQVNAGDEIYYLAQATERVLAKENARLTTKAFPQLLEQLSEENWQGIGNTYIELCSHLAGSKRLTDKMPLNYKAIGVIKKALPKAKIVYCQRNDNDLLWGCYKQMFGAGNGFTYHLDELSKMIKAQRQLMQHWQSIYPDQIFTLDYHALIESQAEVTKALLAYLELDWQDDCLSFYRNSRTVHTLSNVQIRKPLSDKHQNQWLHYQDYLAPYLTSLDAK